MTRQRRCLRIITDMADVEIPILPPGPSEEFLRRQALAAQQQALIDAELKQQKLGIATAGSFDPSTGESRSLSAVHKVAQPESEAMRMLEAVRQQMNSRRYNTQAEAQTAATQFLAMRAAQQMRERGVPEDQIWAALGRQMFIQNNNPYAHARAVSELGPVMSPTVTESGGVKILRYGKGGTQARVVPQSALPGNEFVGGEEFTTPGGTTLVRVSPNRLQVVEKNIPTGRMTDHEKQQILDLRAEQKAIAKELSDLGQRPRDPLFGSSPSKAQVAYDEKIRQLDAIKAKRDEIYNRSEARQSKTDTPEKVTVIKDGKKFRLPSSQLEEAQKQGYQLVK